MTDKITVVGEPITAKELGEIIERVQSGESTLEQEAARNLVLPEDDPRQVALVETAQAKRKATMRLVRECVDQITEPILDAKKAGLCTCELNIDNYSTRVLRLVFERLLHNGCHTQIERGGGTCHVTVRWWKPDVDGVVMFHKNPFRYQAEWIAACMNPQLRYSNSENL